MVLHALTLVIQRRLIADVARCEALADIRVPAPLCPPDISPAGSRLVEPSRLQAVHRLSLSYPHRGSAGEVLAFYASHGAAVPSPSEAARRAHA